MTVSFKEYEMENQLEAETANYAIQQWEKRLAMLQYEKLPF